MSFPVFYVPAGDVLPIFFDSFDGGTGASITMTGLAVTDIEIYKDGSVTQRASDNGYTLLDTDGIDFDSLTGIHGFSIDTGDNSDASFYTVGAWFTVVVSAITIDAQTVSFVAAQFRIMKAESIAGVPKADVDAWLGTAAATPTTNGVPEVDVTHWLGTAAATPTVAGVPEVDVTHYAGSTTDVSTIPASVAAILVDTATIDTAAEIANAVWDADATGHQTGGTFGQAIGDPGASTETLFKAIITDPAGTNIAADVIAIKADTAATLVDTNELQTDWVNGGRLDLILDIIAADTTTDIPALIATLQGFVDTEVAAIKAKTDSLTFTVANQVDANTIAISGDSVAADRLEAMMDGIIVAQVNDAAASTTVFIADGFTEATNDHFNGRLITFISGALSGQQTAITDYVGATQTITVTALTEAPAENDFFVIH